MPDASLPAAAAERHALARGDVVLAVAGLRKLYGGNEVVRGLSFEIRRGECFGLLGPNGAGKTTTLRCCLGLIDPDGGTIEMVGEPVPRAARRARIRVGVVPQQDNLDPDFTVTENLQVYGSYFGIDQAKLSMRIPALLEFAGLAGRSDAHLRVSGTEREGPGESHGPSMLAHRAHVKSKRADGARPGGLVWGSRKPSRIFGWQG